MFELEDNVADLDEFAIPLRQLIDQLIYRHIVAKNASGTACAGLVTGQWNPARPIGAGVIAKATLHFSKPTPAHSRSCGNIVNEPIPLATPLPEP
jgi:hypothetical protein